MMWTRAGDVDVGIIVSSKFPPSSRLWRAGKVQSSKFWGTVLNYESGIRGISGCTNYLDLLKKYKAGNARARLAMDMFIYRIRKYIGSYYASLNGKLDALVFTGKIGAGDPATRRLIVKDLPFLRDARKIVVPPNEELMMVKIIHGAKIRVS
jgi:acetate kinase